MPPHTDIRIRLLGDLEVQRPDATVVASGEWRTGKTMDLLRILALNNGRPVRVSSVIDKLWPSVSLDKARASLRTAGSQIRRATGVNCIARQSGSLVLRGAWVDAIRFLDDARLVHTATLAARHVRALNLTRAAERLYRDDFHAYNDESPWVRAERDHLLQARKTMLCEAAEAAIALGRYHEALELAGTAAGIDRTSETAHRALMRAHAALGEIGSALRTFEACRAYLAEELGADPSAQTRALHVRLLRGESA
jgi:DNA-binding SARP family transcriptional activator